MYELLTGRRLASNLEGRMAHGIADQGLKSLTPLELR